MIKQAIKKACDQCYWRDIKKEKPLGKYSSMEENLFLIAGIIDGEEFVFYTELNSHDSSIPEEYFQSPGATYGNITHWMPFPNHPSK